MFAHEDILNGARRVEAQRDRFQFTIGIPFRVRGEDEILKLLKILKIVVDDLGTAIQSVKVPKIIKEEGRLFGKVSPNDFRFDRAPGTQ
jgi:hypothetical protein